MNYFNYFSEIEQTFIRRRGRNLLLSPLDWALIETWQERGIPLRIVLRGIDRVFDSYEQSANRRRTIKSLTYCKEEIEAQYAEWLESQVGKNGGTKKRPAERPPAAADEPESAGEFSEREVAEHLRRSAGELAAARDRAAGALRQTLEQSTHRLAELIADRPPEQRELGRILEQMDESIDRVLVSSYADEQTRAEIKKQIGAYRDRMEKATYRRTYDLMLIRALREKTRIPRLSLFYL